MKRLWLSVLSLSSLAGAAGWQEYSYGNIGGWKPLYAWCDTPGRVLAATQPARSSGPTTLAQWVGGKLTTQTYQLGPGDAGAGNLYTGLTPLGRPVGEMPPYLIHSSNVENVNDPAYRMTHVYEFRVPAGEFRCRYEPQAAVLAATTRHSVIVWESGGRVTYASLNRDGTPGVRLTGGQHTRNAGGQERYTWTRNGYRYVLEVGSPDRTNAGGALSVFRGGRLLSREELLAYTISVPR